MLCFPWRHGAVVVAFGFLFAACSGIEDPPVAVAGVTQTSAQSPDTTLLAPTTAALTTTPPTTTPPTTLATSTTTEAPVAETPRLGSPAPDWIGTRLLNLRADGLGVAEPTPVELVDRRLWTVDVLAPPPGSEFVASLTTPPPVDVLERSTWRPDCPVSIDDLAYGQVSFYGFDGLFHTGEFIVHQDFAEGVVEIFEQLYEARFPIEEMRVTTQADVDAPRTGDDNNTSSFVCRNAVGSNNWSRHAFGGAIDINPFHNPFRRGDLVLPELASAYVDRGNERPGMVTPTVVALFEGIGWGWGGNWRSVDDWMHFSDTGN